MLTALFWIWVGGMLANLPVAVAAWRYEVEEYGWLLAVLGNATGLMIWPVFVSRALLK